MRRSLLLSVAVLAILAPHLRPDEPIRRAQEELRKRNLYFGDVDGQMKPELVDALKHYQARKGFDVTGGLNEETANSLNVPLAASSESPAQNWPDIPVLKSDAARGLPEPERIALEKQAEANPGVTATSPGSPAGAANVKPEELTKLVQHYLHDAETDDVDLQVSYYAFPMDYFDHGRVDREFVVRDTRNYVKRWPQREYKLVGSLKVYATGANGQTQVEFTISFGVRNKKHAVSGKTKNFWTLQPQGGNLKIVAVKEQRLHE